MLTLLAIVAIIALVCSAPGGAAMLVRFLVTSIRAFFWLSLFAVLVIIATSFAG